jgi:DNA mismatch repair protein MSH5
MILALYSSTPCSLVIVDEFGKGTTEIDGLALLASCLDHFLSRGVKCPHVLASTHFHDVVNLVQKSRYLKLQVNTSKKNM